ncbi:hypothetical protein [Intrasporangium calvum]|uniref:hypothetical protein n=1 Tax=Intrasporangium calvum TaxID=53358 RepID=UPI001F4222EC|nr:hypothetical protein [Intrasporangium calvum]
MSGFTDFTDDVTRKFTRKLLVLARLDGHVPVAQNEVDLDDVAHDAVETLRRHTDLVLDIAVDPLPAVRVRGDGPQLARVGRNLLENAARHARSRARRVGGRRRLGRGAGA